MAATSAKSFHSRAAKKITTGSGLRHEYIVLLTKIFENLTKISFISQKCTFLDVFTNYFA